MDSTFFLVIAIGAIVIQSFLLFLALFEPGLRYKIRWPVSSEADPDKFRRTLEVLTRSNTCNQTQVEVLTNGNQFYESELQAISQARRSINLEAYIFQKGDIGSRFVEAMAERARAGVRVSIVLDALGSLTTTKGYFKPVLAAGGRLAWYHPLRWHTWPRFNSRTHRELLIVDGTSAFVGGAGIADHWYKPAKKRAPWRDTVCRVTGDAVAGLQGSFAENWLEAYGEILMGPEHFPFVESQGGTGALVVTSSPSTGRSTPARILYQTLLASASKSIHICTPYFLPDRSARAEVVRAIKERGVQVTILVPGKRSDHLLTRRSSRRLYGELLRAGAEIHEYKPTMLHVKCLIIDGTWSVVGSTNFDYRSFGLNDEVNLAVYDTGLAKRLELDFAQDLISSHQVRLRAWQTRPLIERAHEWLGWILERQQ
jgi:cardiolipin synthase